MTGLVLHDLEAFAGALRDHVRVLLFKHSPTCPISAAARREYEAFTAAYPDVPTLFVDVVGDRPTSQGIARLAAVQHESPQAILFEGGRPVWHTSHHGITRGALEARWFGAC